MTTSLEGERLTISGHVSKVLSLRPLESFWVHCCEGLYSVLHRTFWPRISWGQKKYPAQKASKIMLRVVSSILAYKFAHTYVEGTSQSFFVAKQDVHHTHSKFLYAHSCAGMQDFAFPLSSALVNMPTLRSQNFLDHKTSHENEYWVHVWVCACWSSYGFYLLVRCF